MTNAIESFLLNMLVAHEISSHCYIKWMLVVEQNEEPSLQLCFAGIAAGATQRHLSRN